MTILNKILEEKYREIEKLKETPVKKKREVMRPSLFQKLQSTEHLQVIAEIKRASPSKGTIYEGEKLNPVNQALTYEEAGAACISVLTDTPFFKGSFHDLQEVAEAVDLPVLCKDFIVDEIQIDRAKAAGASVILLIVAALDDATLERLYAYAVSLRLEILVEVHGVEELARALRIGAKIIGVNNRDLKTFTMDLSRTKEVAAAFPFDENHVLISESGILGEEDAREVSEFGVSGILVGEFLMRSNSVKTAIQAMQIPLKR